MNDAMFRRNSAFAGIGLAVLLSAAAACKDVPSGGPSQLHDLESRYSIKIINPNSTGTAAMSSGTVSFDPAPADLVASYSPLLWSELNRYPTELVQRTKLRRIVLAGNLRFGPQLRTAVPDWEHNVLYLDVTRGRFSSDYCRRVFHHEFFHIIDYVDDGQVYSDDAWSALNSPGFQYGSGGAQMQNDSSASILTSDTPGFLDKYSMQGVEEDKAELFAYLMVELDYVAQRTQSDPVLARKMAALKSLLQRFCPTLPGDFWTNSQQPSLTRSGS